MNIQNAIILCAGFGKRVMPLTKSTPKPLLKISGIHLLNYSIKFLKEIGVKNIAINSHYLANQISDFVNKFDNKIKIFYEEKILDTGGALVNAKTFFTDEHFIVMNSDTIWQKKYVSSFNIMKKKYFDTKAEGALLLSTKELSFDKRLPCDFGLDEKDLLLNSPKNYIFTGCQILNKNVLENKSKSFFSVREIWNDLIVKKKIIGQKHDDSFLHVTDFEIYNKLLKQKITY